MPIDLTQFDLAPTPRRAAKPPSGPMQFEVLARPCVVDGVRYPSISAAARAIGANTSGLGDALRHGRPAFKTHSVRWAEDSDGD